jgi:CheY-like chemotaxis protein
MRLWKSMSRRYARVFENLVFQRGEYSPNGKRIVVGSRRSELGIVAFVKDEGQGLTEEDKQKLFGKFQRLSARPTGGESSTGLGLSIVKQLVELHGGRVWAESDGKNQGTTFFVALPLASPAHKGETVPDLADSASSVEETKERVSLPPIRVVLIEDNLELLEELARQFTHDARFTLTGKYDSAELALALLEEVDVVLIDIGLPGISGIDAIQKVKAEFPNAKIVMLTVKDDDRHISRALIAGAHGYLTKQTPIPKILDAVVDAFQFGMPMSPSVASA